MPKFAPYFIHRTTKCCFRHASLLRDKRSDSYKLCAGDDLAAGVISSGYDKETCKGGHV